MAQPNWWILLVAAFIPLIIAHLWYGQLFKSLWLKTAEITEERSNSGNLIKILGLTYLYSLFAAYIICMFAVHQTSIFQLFMGDPALSDTSSEIYKDYNNFMFSYGDRHRSFFHGIIHGFELALLLGLSFIGIHSMFERRPYKYVLIHLGFWILSFMIMGGIICQFF